MKQTQVMSEAVKVRFTPKQYKQIEKLAKQHNMSKPQYIREVVFG